MPITVEEIEKRMATASYMKGYSFSPADTVAFKGLSSFPSQGATPNAFRWAKHIAALTGLQLGASTASAQPAAAKPVAAVKVASSKAAADELDLFGDEEEEDDGAIVNDMGETAEEVKAAEARRARMAAAAKLKADADAKKNANKPVEKKEKPAEKSLIVLDVKPWEADTDLVMVWKEICKTEQPGLTWGQSYKLEPMAFGIKKLVMTCTIVDAIVLMDDVTDKITAMEDWVQSVEIASMNKIS
jgi:elongation factor 1-beta